MSYLAIPVSIIPDSVRTNMENQDMTFSNDGQFLLLHDFPKYESGTIDYWLRDESEHLRPFIVQGVLDNSINYTKSEIVDLMNDPNSIWYVGD